MLALWVSQFLSGRNTFENIIKKEVIAFKRSIYTLTLHKIDITIFTGAFKLVAFTG